MVWIPERFSGLEFKRLFILSEIGAFTPEQYSQYMKSLKDMSDYYNIIDTAAEEAEKRGLAKGLAKGLEQGRKEIIRLMHSKGMDASAISAIVDIEVSEI